MAAISPVTLVTMAASSAVTRSLSGAGTGSARVLEVWRKALRRTRVVCSEKSGMGVAILGVQMGHPALAQGKGVSWDVGVATPFCASCAARDGPVES